jgi:hypothetical protein
MIEAMVDFSRAVGWQREYSRHETTITAIQTKTGAAKKQRRFWFVLLLADAWY